MARSFVDYIIPENHSSFKDMLEVGALLGFSIFWVDNRRINQEDQRQTLTNRIKIIPRLDIDQQDSTKDKIISILRHQRRKIPIIAIKADNVGLARNIKGHWRLIGFGEIIQ